MNIESSLFGRSGEFVSNGPRLSARGLQGGCDFVHLAASFADVHAADSIPVVTFPQQIDPLS
jgi:hypothetical protein